MTNVYEAFAASLKSVVMHSSPTLIGNDNTESNQSNTNLAISKIALTFTPYLPL